MQQQHIETVCNIYHLINEYGQKVEKELSYSILIKSLLIKIIAINNLFSTIF